MRISRNRLWLLIIILAWFVAGAVAADRVAISGVVRDTAGKPLGGVHITLTGSQTSQSTYQTASGRSGEYRFTDVVPGEYTLSAELGGYAPSASLLVHVHPTDASLVFDIELAANSSTSGDAATPAQSPLEFKTAGIRGLIDPGGYSASTNSAASSLLRGIADINRTDRSGAIAAAKSWPCSLEPELREAAAEHPGQAAANLRLGQFYVAHAEPAKAIPFLKRAVEIDADDDDASRQLAIAWLQSGDFEDARKTLSSLAERNAGAATHQLLARADEGSAMFLQAAQEYRLAEEKEHSEESLFGVGYELILAGSLVDAATAFETGVREYPRSIPLWIGTGTAQFLLGKTSEGIHSFLNATDIDPSNPQPYPFLSSASAASDKESDRVRGSFKRFLDRNPDSATANYDYALALLRDRSTANANLIEVLLKRATQLNPNLAQAHLQLGDIYAQRDHYEDAAAEFEAAVRSGENAGTVHYRLAMAYKHLGHLEQEQRELEIFRLSAKNQASRTVDKGIDISQFISVMDAPDRHAIQEMECPFSLH